MRHAPPGGTSIGGDRYEGGQFLPQDDFTRSSNLRKSLDETLGAIRAGREVLVDCFDGEKRAVVLLVSTSGVLCRYVDRFGLPRDVRVEPRHVRPYEAAPEGDSRG